jgi:hypothetical protein
MKKKQNKKEKRISYDAMTSQGEDPLLKYIKKDEEDKNEPKTKDEIPTESTH